MTKQENLLKSYLDYNMKCPRFTATHIAKSLEMPTARPKLVKECVCPNPRGTAKLLANWLKMNKGQLVTRGIKHWGLSGYANILPRIKFGVI